jgi:hypothetical protein
LLREILNCLHWPFCPGVFIAILALVSAVVVWVLGERAKSLEKGIWTLVFFLLVVSEFWMMGIDRRNHDKEQADARADQLRKFQEIAAGIKDSNDTNKQHFDTTMTSMKGLINTANRSLTQVTGNHQFCYLMAMLPLGLKDNQGQPLFPLLKMNSGSLPLDVCHVAIQKISPLTPGEDLARQAAENMRVLADQQLGPLPPGKVSGRSGTRGFGTNIVVLEGSYYIHINTRNDWSYETLTIHPNVPGKGLESIEVRNDQWKIVYSEP